MAGVVHCVIWFSSCCSLGVPLRAGGGRFKFLWECICRPTIFIQAVVIGTFCNQLMVYYYKRWDWNMFKCSTQGVRTFWPLWYYKRCLIISEGNQNWQPDNWDRWCSPCVVVTGLRVGYCQIWHKPQNRYINSHYIKMIKLVHISVLWVFVTN